MNLDEYAKALAAEFAIPVHAISISRKNGHDCRTVQINEKWSLLVRDDRAPAPKLVSIWLRLFDKNYDYHRELQIVWRSPATQVSCLRIADYCNAYMASPWEFLLLPQSPGDIAHCARWICELEEPVRSQTYIEVLKLVNDENILYNCMNLLQQMTPELKKLHDSIVAAKRLK